MSEQSQDTEITLGTGKMLFLFFGLVALCSAFFALGFKVGKASGPEVSSLPSAATPSTNTRPSTTKPATSPGSDLTFYKAVGQDNASSQLTPDNTNKAQASNTPPATEETRTDPMAAPPANGYFVQVAAVSKQEDAESLVDALKKKQYAAFANVMTDKLYHVQVGPFGDIKDAEVTRAKLVSDGYNPILKK
jgi:cell division septation protein DedD